MLMICVVRWGVFFWNKSFLFQLQEFFQYYAESGGLRPANDEENKMDLLKKGIVGSRFLIYSSLVNSWSIVYLVYPKTQKECI